MPDDAPKPDTRNDQLTPPTNIAPKTSAAVAAGGISVAVVSILAWGLSYAHITIPPDVAVAFSTLFTGVASYYAPRSHQTTTEPKP